MTYDLRFVRCRPGQSWDEAYDEAEDQDPVAPRPEVWQRVVDRVRPLLIDAEDDLTDGFGEIDDLETGLQLILYEDSADMHVPYGSSGDDAEGTLATMYAIASIVEEETGLECFDRQVSLPLAEASADRPRGLAMFETVAKMFRRNRS